MGSFIGSLGAKASGFELKFVLMIIGLIIAIVVVSVLLDGIRKVIRGLDVAALGVLIIWLGHKASKIAVVSVVTRLMYLIGGTLLIVGIVTFILLKLFRSKRKARKAKDKPKEPKKPEQNDEPAE